MTIAEFLRRNGGRMTGTVAAVGLAAAAAIGTARAEGPIATHPAFMPSALFSHPAPADSLKPNVTAPGPAAPHTTWAAPMNTQAIAFAAPLPGFTVNSNFGLRQLAFEPHARLHEGVDIAAPVGEPIHATAPGEISRTGLSLSYGHFVEVAHADGLKSFYAHMSRTAGLRAGAPVTAGEVLGFVGSTGHSTGPHLHFEIRKDGAPMDPQLFLNRQFAKLNDLPRAVAQAPHMLLAHAGASWRQFASLRVNGRVRSVINAVSTDAAAPAARQPEAPVETAPAA